MPPISSHTLRHTGCTRLGENNVNPKVMQYVICLLYTSKLPKKASEPLYKTPKSIQETIEIMAVAENGIFEVSKNKYSKCTHRNYPMIELKQYIDNIVLNSNMFFSVAVPIMREINTNIRRLSAHTTIMTYEELVNTCLLYTSKMCIRDRSY